MSPVLILALFLPFQATPSDKCSISGTVVDSVTGAPLNKVELRLEPMDRQTTPVAVTTSDAQGRFAMVDLDPGKYHLKGQRTGYLPMSYGARRPTSDGAPIQLEAGPTAQDLTFKLTPAAEIAGTVRDSDGDPLENAVVAIMRLTYRNGRPRVEGYGGDETDDQGGYRIRGLVAGKYYIGVTPAPRNWDEVDHSAHAASAEASVPTFYPGVPDLAAAAPMEVSTGRQVTGMDVTLLRSRVFRVSGRVTNMPAAGRLLVFLHDPKDPPGTRHEMETTTKDAAGDFELRGVPPGSYELGVLTRDEEHEQEGVAPVVVGASDVEGVRVTLAPNAVVKAQITVEGTVIPKLSELNFGLTRGSGYSAGPVTDDGVETIQGLLPDHYDVGSFGRMPPGFYVKSIRSGDTDVLANGITVAASETIPLEIVLASDGSAVQGVVLDKDQQPFAGATIVLVPAQRSRADLFKSATSDQNGRYEFASVTPGDYKVFAWDDVEPDAWNDPDFLKDYEKQGEKTVLEPKARSTVNLHSATGPDVQ